TWDRQYVFYAPDEHSEMPCAFPLGGTKEDDNAALIVALRNALPTLTAALREAARLREVEAERDRMREALERVAKYIPSVSRVEVDRTWRGITTSSGYAPVPELNQDRALCDLISFDDLRK